MTVGGKKRNSKVSVVTTGKRVKHFKPQRNKVPVMETENGVIKAGGDALEKFLTMMDDADDWRTLANPETGESIKLTATEVDIIRRIKEGEYGDVNYDPYEPYVDFFTGTMMEVPLSAASEPKRRFTPSKWEALKVAKLVRAIRKGIIKLAVKDGGEDDEKVVYDIWSGEVDAAVLAARSRHISAPRMRLPEHRESYNPPTEYLLTEEERAAWEAMDKEDRPHNFIPQKFGALRLVPGYSRAVQERFGRCLDLFLCPRAVKDKIRMHPDDLLPKLPDPRELRPFPTQRSIEFVGHEAGICSVSVDPTGQWMLSADRMGVVRLWDVQTGHCRRTWNCQSASDICLAWNPNKALFMFALGFGSILKLIVPPGMAGTDATLLALEDMKVKSDITSVDSIKWKTFNADEEGTVMTIEHPARLSEIQWHRRGDYFAGLCPEANTGAHVLTVHQLSSRTSRQPFRKMPGLMRAVRFHPTRPHLVLVTQKTVRIYDLVKNEHLKKLMPGVQSLTSIAVHSGGDNLIVGSHDAKLCWFDLDYSVRPYRVLTSHKASIRSVAFHPSYPLFATGGDDGVIQVVHGQVYDDLATNPMIVPVKTIKDFGVAAVTLVQFHPVQPWLFAATSDGTIALYV